MAELTDREKKIVCINFIMHSPQFGQVPIDLREQMLMLAIKIRGMKYEKEEMLDLGEALVKERDMILQTQIGWLQKHKESVKGLAGVDL